MSDAEIPQEEVKQWIQEAITNEDITDFVTTFTGKSEKGDGFTGDVIFAKVTGFTKSTNESTELDLVLKIGRKNMREAFCVRELYEREIFAYSKIFPEFKNFEIEKGVRNIFDSVAKCYKAIFLENVEVLIVEDFRARGYELHDKQVPLNDAHIELILRNYASFHAISFAMRDQNGEQFEELTVNYDRIPKLVLVTDIMRAYNDQAFKKIKNFIENNDEELAELFCQVFENNITDVAVDILNADVEESVVTHGDNWNNNFMFKYEDKRKTTPSDVAILDWQLSCLHSPVLDLSYFLYIVSGEEQVPKFDEYLQYYHARLSKYITALGSDPEKLFPFSTLIDHWEKYSAYGIIFVINSLEVMLSDKETAASLDDVELDASVNEWLTKVTPVDLEVFKERLFATMRHYCTHVKNGI